MPPPAPTESPEVRLAHAIAEELTILMNCLARISAETPERHPLRFRVTDAQRAAIRITERVQTTVRPLKLKNSNSSLKSR
jgi:hypothetical protein